MSTKGCRHETSCHSLGGRLRRRRVSIQRVPWKSADFDPVVARARSLRECASAIGTAGEPFDIVVLDLGLPDSDGITPVDRVKIFTRLPLIVLSGNEDDGAAETLMSSGALRYLVKGKVSGAEIAHAISDAYSSAISRAISER